MSQKIKKSIDSINKTIGKLINNKTEEKFIAEETSEIKLSHYYTLINQRLLLKIELLKLKDEEFHKELLNNLPKYE